MECKINNDLGQITITEDVLLKVAGYAALECYGIVAMSSKRAKDGFVEWLGRENLTKHSNMPHFIKLTDESFIFNIVEILAKYE